MDSEKLIADIKDETERIYEVVQKELSTLDDNELNFKEHPKKWSAIECIEHLNIAMRHYNPEIEKGINRSEGKGIALQFKPGLMGNYFTKMMRPNDGKVTNGMKTMARFDPKRSFVNSENTINEFLEHLTTFQDLLDRSKAIDLNRAKVKSALGSMLMFKLGDAFRFVSGHNARHLIQAQNAIKKSQNAVAQS